MNQWPLEKRQAFYNKEILENPETIQNYEGIMFAAGGGLPKTFGQENNKIWQDVLKKIKENDNNKIEIAGINFSKQELKALGDFYRWLGRQGINFQCIDERLVNIADYGEVEVHCGCGACAAVGAAANDGESYESELARQLWVATEHKQPIREDFPHHASTHIYVDFSAQGRGFSDEARQKLAQIRDLPFQVSLPLELMAQYIEENDLADGDQKLVAALVKWNVQIAQNIIAGDHNERQDEASKSTLIVDERNVEASDELRPMVEAQLESVIPQERWQSTKT